MGTREHIGAGLVGGAHHLSGPSGGRATLPAPTGAPRRFTPSSLPPVPGPRFGPVRLAPPPQHRPPPLPVACETEPSLEPDLERAPKPPSGEYTSWARVTYDDAGSAEEARLEPEETDPCDCGQTAPAPLDPQPLPDPLPPPTSSVGRCGGERTRRRVFSPLSVTALAVLLSPGVVFALLRWVDPGAPSTQASCATSRAAAPGPRSVAAPDKASARLTVPVRASRGRGARTRLGASPRSARARPTGPRVRVQAARPLAPAAPTRPGTLRVAAVHRGKPALASIYVDGHHAGQTPLRLRVTAGAHEVAAVLQGAAPMSRRVTLEPDASEWVVFELGAGATGKVEKERVE